MEIKNDAVLYEDDDVAVIDKPAGVVVNRSETVKEDTIQDWWQRRAGESGWVFPPEKKTSWQEILPADFVPEYGTPEEVFAERGGVVHRLDKETSGVLILAKNPGSLIHLLRQFRVREVHKTYQCLVHGKFQVLHDTIRVPLGRSTDNRTKFKVDVDGRDAETEYKVLKTFQGLDAEGIARTYRALEQENQALPHLPHIAKRLIQSYQGFSFVECHPKTGRTHQIRVHMLHLKHPIVADPTYLGQKRLELDSSWCPRLFLHAAQVEFRHPRTGQMLLVKAELPAELQHALTWLRE